MPSDSQTDAREAHGQMQDRHDDEREPGADPAEQREQRQFACL